MRNLITFILLTASLCAYSKTTYIPKYSSYIEIANDTDTSFFEGNKTSLYADDNNTMFRIGIVHETLSVRKIKYIRHNEISASLYAVSAIISGVSSLSSDNSQRFHGRSQMYLSKTLSDIYSQNASAAKRLGINIYIENTSKEEIMVADTERGLVWYLQPGAFYSIPLPNPDMMQFRISDLNHKKISRVTMGAG
ncbi:MAG: hypothetical protein II734_04790, partial [Paludibacteraceae bacterium]|nr:hypothetical protein [Paludibacteraceae bacterium]